MNLKKRWRDRKPPLESNSSAADTRYATRVYETSAPSIQNALDIFAGEWTTRLPGALGEQYQAGTIQVCEDPRVLWCVSELDGIRGMRVLELGPLEGGHTCMLEKAGASEILAIEAHRRAYLRCLVTKEVLQLKRANFLCGDFMEYLRTCNEKFDLCFASGVLYHLINPVELIARAAGVAKRLFLWTHYFDPRFISRTAPLFPNFPKGEPAQLNGFQHTLHRFQYQSPVEFPRFVGGVARHSNWLTQKDILRCLTHFGFDDIRMGSEQPDHPNGPALTLLAIHADSQARMSD